MLVLTAEDLNYCQLLKKNERQKTYRGGIYQGFLFVQIGSFKSFQFEVARQQCRELLEKDGTSAAIVVKEGDRITLWSRASNLNFDRQQDSSPKIKSSQSNLETKIVPQKDRDRSNLLKKAIIALSFLLI